MKNNLTAACDPHTATPCPVTCVLDPPVQNVVYYFHPLLRMTRFTVPHQTSITTHYTTAENETIRPDLFPLEEVNYTLSKPN